MNKLFVLVVLCCIAFVAAKPMKVKPQRPQTDCDICKTLITAIESWMEDGKTVDQIEKDLDQVCQWVPAFDAVCEQFVSWGIPEIVKYIETNENASRVCTQIGICSSKAPKPKVTKPKVTTPKAPKKPAQDNCYLCTYVIGAIESWLEANATIQQIEQNLDAVCALIPDFEQQCDSIVATSVPQIVQWIEQNESADDICSQLGFCNSTRKWKSKEKILAQKILPKPPKQDANCFLCETVVGSIESWIEQNSTEQQIEQYLDTVCALVPSFQAQCDAVIAQGLSQIIQWLEQNQTPQQVCTNLGLCTNSTMPYPGRHKINKGIMKMKL